MPVVNAQIVSSDISRVRFLRIGDIPTRTMTNTAKLLIGVDGLEFERTGAINTAQNTTSMIEIVVTEARNITGISNFSLRQQNSLRNMRMTAAC